MNYYQKPTKENIKELLLTACEVSGKSYSDRILDIYWEMLREIPLKDLRKSFLAFNASATFPSAAKVMACCGFTPPTTEPRQSEAPLAQDEKPDSTYKEQYGTWTFETRYFGDTLAGAEPEFDRCRQILVAAGWKIQQETTFDGILESQHGKYTKKEKMLKIHFLASRPDPKEPVEPEETRFVAAIDRIAKMKTAAEVANKVMKQVHR